MKRRLSVLAVVGFSLMVIATPIGALTSPWHPMKVPTSPNRGYGQPTCLDQSHCWVPYGTSSAAGILVTLNAGRTWFASRLSTPVNVIDSVSCSSITVCAAVGFDMKAGGTPRAVALFSSDGGRLWSTATLPPTYTPSHGSWTRLDSLNCRSNEECVATGAGPAPPALPVSCGSGCTYVPGPTNGTIALWALTSTDGGATWSGSTIESSLPDQAYQINCSSATTCAAVGFGFGSCPAGQRCTAHGLAFYYNAAAPTQWSLVPVPTGVFSVYSLSCPTASLCLAVGSTGDAETGHGVVLRSQNGGRSWQRLRAPAGSNSIQSISCVNQHTCLAAGGMGTSSYVQPTVFLTTNAGGTWRVGAVSAVQFMGAVTCPVVHFCLMTGSLALGADPHGVVLAGSA